MRVGQNPAKFVDSVPQPKKITVAVVSYIPFLDGYFAQSLDILKLCLESIGANTDLPYDLFVFDNASCPEVQSTLIEAKQNEQIQYLLLSDKNIGKAGAWNFIFAAAPGDYIAYADCDVYFHPGWLGAQLEVLEALPEAGMVTGMPVRNPEKFSTSTVNWAEGQGDVQLERGQFLPWEHYWKHTRSLGYTEDKARQIYDQTEDLRISHRGKEYYVGAGHFQFIAPTKVLREVLPIPSRRPMGEVRLLDIAINERGYLRLSLPEFTIEHLGNSLPAGKFTINGQKTKNIEPQKKSRFLKWKPVRKTLQWVYRRTFDALYRD